MIDLDLHLRLRETKQVIWLLGPRLRDHHTQTRAQSSFAFDPYRQIDLRSCETENHLRTQSEMKSYVR